MLENSCLSETGQLCPICLSCLSDSQLVVLPCLGSHAFHRECLKSWLLSGKRSCPCDREKVNQAVVDEIIGAAETGSQTASISLTSERLVDVKVMFEAWRSGDVQAFVTSTRRLICSLERAENDLSVRSRTLPQAAKAFLGYAFGDRDLQYPSLQSQDTTAQHTSVKQLFAEVLRTCIGFLRHQYFRSDPSHHNRIYLMITILRKRRSLQRRRCLAFKYGDNLHQVGFFGSLSSTDRAILHSANDGLVWYVLKRLVADRLPPGASELELALQRSCIGLLDEMYLMWRITDFGI